MKKIVSALILTGILFLSACEMEESAFVESPVLKTEIKTVKIGVLMPMSGDIAAYGEEVQKIFDYCLIEINKNAEEKGYQFELVYEDSKCDGSSSVLAYQKLTDLDDVKFILGGFCSTESLAIAPLLKEKNVVAISSTSSSPELKNKSSYFFSLSYSDDFIGGEIAKELGKYKNVAIITEQNDYNKALRAVVVQSLKENFPDTDIVVDEEFPKGASDFRNALQKIKNGNPEIIFLNPNPGVTSLSMAKQLGEIKNWKVKKVASYAFYTPELQQISPEVFDDTLIIDSPNINTTEFKTLMDSIIKSKGEISNLGNYYSAATLDAIDILTEEIIDNDADSVSVQFSLATDSFTGFTGNIAFDKNSFVKNRESAKFVLRNGKLESL